MTKLCTKTISFENNSIVYKEYIAFISTNIFLQRKTKEIGLIVKGNISFDFTKIREFGFACLDLGLLQIYTQKYDTYV